MPKDSRLETGLLETISQMKQVLIYEWLRNNGSRDGLKEARLVRKHGTSCDTCGKYCSHVTFFTADWVTVRLDVNDTLKYQLGLRTVLSVLGDYFDEWMSRVGGEESPFVVMYDTKPEPVMDIIIDHLVERLDDHSVEPHPRQYVAEISFEHNGVSMTSKRYPNMELLGIWMYTMMLKNLDKMPMYMDIQFQHIDAFSE